MASSQAAECIDIFDFYNVIDEQDEIQPIESNINYTEDTQNNYCDCGGKMEISNNLITLSCNLCGKISEYEEDVGVPSSSSNLVYRGPNNAKYQGELYGSSKIDTAKVKTKHIHDEYMKYYNEYVIKSGQDFPKDAFMIATDIFNKIQSFGTKRSENKKRYMGACLFIACHSIKYSPSINVITKFMDLKKNGLETELSIINDMIDEGKIFTEKIDIISSEISTIFNKLKINDNTKYFHLKELIAELIRIANNNFISIETLPQNKNIGAIYIILSKHKDLIGKISLQEICEMKGIRMVTIQQYITELDAYKSKFKHIYEKINE